MGVSIYFCYLKQTAARRHLSIHPCNRLLLHAKTLQPCCQSQIPNHLYSTCYALSTREWCLQLHGCPRFLWRNSISPFTRVPSETPSLSGMAGNLCTSPAKFSVEHRGLGNAATVSHKRLASLLSSKWDQPYCNSYHCWTTNKIKTELFNDIHEDSGSH